MSNPGHLRILGDFAEWHHEPRDDLPSIVDAIGGGPGQPTQRRLAFYLLQGSDVRATMEMAADVVDGEEVYLSAGLLSDGDWVWRADLPHYVEKYNLALPQEFIDHASSYLWSPGVLSEPERIRCAEQLRADSGD